MFMQVHDELVFELDAKMAELHAIEIKALMSNALKLSIPLDVDVGVGQRRPLVLMVHDKLPF